MKQPDKKKLLISLVIVLTACGQPNTHDKSVEALKTTRSWTATAQMVGEAWQQGNIPDRYAQQTLTKSQQEIGKAMQELDTPPVLLQQVQQAIQNETQIVEHHNKVAIGASLQTISAKQRQLKALAQAEGAEP